jgi:NAD/NADP transhydrogenase beta subunit
MGMLYGIFGMSALIAVYWSSSWYTYGDGLWLVAVSMIPGAIVGIWSSYAVEMTSLPEMVGAYNGFGGLAAALEGFGLYLDPSATFLVRNGDNLVSQTNPMVRTFDVI